MHIEVDMDLCDLHGQCTFAAPDVFRFTDSGDLNYDPEPSEDQREAVEEAIDVCPVQAITMRVSGVLSKG
ncbi:ferredoxin [Streptosporangium sp. NPDC087985]|uniref:ferredoxin n=1 Tax=Streptosporangium sp. NPDC087985 TaxID=3366196 RepID=UPI00380CA6E1